MIIVTVHYQLKDISTSDYLEKFNKLAPTVRAEQGCLEYEIYQTENKEKTLFLFERWESRPALDQHLQSPHMKQWAEDVKNCFASKEIIVYEGQENSL